MSRPAPQEPDLRIQVWLYWEQVVRKRRTTCSWCGIEFRTLAQLERHLEHSSDQQFCRCLQFPQYFRWQELNPDVNNCKHNPIHRSIHWITLSVGVSYFRSILEDNTQTWCMRLGLYYDRTPNRVPYEKDAPECPAPAPKRRKTTGSANTCKCGSTTHQRTSSKQCPLYKNASRKRGNTAVAPSTVGCINSTTCVFEI